MSSPEIRASKFLSLVLRHRPERIGLKLDGAGWADVDDLLEKAREAGVPLTRELLEEVVETNDKRRFALSPDGLRIRASQGHSVPVDLGLEPASPPPVLYHGTGHGAVESILRDGLQPRGRQHVHLSPDAETARRVGQRHGKPVVLRVDAGGLAADGHAFFLSENGVWLTDAVPPGYLAVAG